MKLTLVFVACFLLLAVEGRGRKEGVKTNNKGCEECRKPCELRTCQIDEVCFERLIRCHSGITNGTVSHCANNLPNQCNCNNDEICVKTRKSETSCRVKADSPEISVVSASKSICPNKENTGGKRRKEGSKNRKTQDHKVCEECRKPCELRTCQINEVCFERLIQCHSGITNGTVSHCANNLPNQCNCNNDEICVKTRKSETSCRVKADSPDISVVGASKQICPNKENIGGKRRGGKGHRG